MGRATNRNHAIWSQHFRWPLSDANLCEALRLKSAGCLVNHLHCLFDGGLEQHVRSVMRSTLLESY